MTNQRTDREGGQVKPLWLRVAVVAPMIPAAVHAGFLMVEHGNSPLVLIYLFTILAYAMAIGPTIAPPPRED